MLKEDSQKSDIQFITCPICNDAGKAGKGSACKNCSGAGLIAFHQGRFFYWNLLLTVPAIKLRHLKKGLNLVLNLSAYLMGLAGLIALTYWVWAASQNTQALEAFSFWRVKSPLILTFWISLLADMFVIYRLSQEEAAKQKITKPKYNQAAKHSFPDNWSEFNKVKGKYKIEVSSGFSLSALKAIEQAFNLAAYAKQGRVRPIHLFFNLLKDRGAAAIFSRLNIDSAKLIAKLKNQLLALEAGTEVTEISPEIKEIFLESYISALNSGQKRVEPIHFILPILARDKNLSELLYDLEIDHDKINNVIQWFIIS